MLWINNLTEYNTMMPAHILHNMIFCRLFIVCQTCANCELLKWGAKQNSLFKLKYLEWVRCLSYSVWILYSVIHTVNRNISTTIITHVHISTATGEINDLGIHWFSIINQVTTQRVGWIGTDLNGIKLTVSLIRAMGAYNNLNLFSLVYWTTNTGFCFS